MPPDWKMLDEWSETPGERKMRIARREALRRGAIWALIAVVLTVALNLAWLHGRWAWWAAGAFLLTSVLDALNLRLRKPNSLLFWLGEMFILVGLILLISPLLI